ncbi:MFS transporter [Erysipelothrix urinaevulpis]|uniref:MFS transporter n=1 Tax=Erysipelothrix urinaevulpis TaxID=2683717 RepID=UPI001358EEBD|nr:MFS transporter [Erysipelothrix urinaevulpis]
MKKNKYNLTAFAIYMNYFVHGIQAIIISQNAASFAVLWNTDKAGVMGVISAVGIGKFLILFFAGELSDRFGRKPLALIGMFGYILFFGLLLVNTNLFVASFVAFIAGAATSFLDAASYPALMEIYPNNQSTASVIVKGFISTSGMLLPIFIGFLTGKNMWYGWSIVLPLVIIIINTIIMLKADFPDHKKIAKEETESEAAKEIFVVEPRYNVEGVMIIIYAFFCMSTFYLFQQVITLYGTDVVGMSDMSARFLTTTYTFGAFLAVFVSSMLMSKGIREMALLVIYTLISSLALMMIYLFPSATTLSIGAPIVGFTAAGGVLQMGNALLSRFFPARKGRNTGIYNIFMASATFVMPKIAQYLLNVDFTKVMLLDAGVAIVGFILMVILATRYKKVFGLKSIFEKEER